MDGPMDTATQSERPEKGLRMNSVGLRSNFRILLILGTLTLAAGAILLLALSAVETQPDPLERSRFVNTVQQANKSIPKPAIAAGLPSCPQGTTPVLDIARYPNSPSKGQPSVNAALAAANAELKLNIALERVSKVPFDDKPGAPVWIVAGDKSLIATQTPAGGWFVSPAKLVKCHDPVTEPLPKASVGQAQDGPVG